MLYELPKKVSNTRSYKRVPGGVEVWESRPGEEPRRIGMVENTDPFYSLAESLKLPEE